MEKNKFFITASTVILAIAGFLTTKANSRKYNGASSTYFKTTFGSIKTVFKGIIGGANNLTTFQISAPTMFVSWGSFNRYTLFSVRSGNTLSKTIFLQ